MKRELELLFKQRSVLWLLAISLCLSGLSVFNGWQNVHHMRTQITHAQHEQKQQHAQQVVEHASQGKIEAGAIGYYMFHHVYRHPVDWSFIALGNLPVTPYIQRIRLLGLQGQLYDGESHHPEYIMLGAFDYAFWLVFFLPLFTIALFHDLKASEHQAHRLVLLQSLLSQPAKFWLMRIALRWVMIVVTFLAPVVIFTLIQSYPWLGLAQVASITVLYSTFWVLLCVLVSMRKQALNANLNAMLLTSIWLLICVVLPNLSQLWLHQRYPVQDGSHIAMQHRQLVHNAWDLPKTDTLTPFYKLYPQWQHTPAVNSRFHWKWYFAFQHMADVKVANLVIERETRLRQRDQVTRWLSYVLPSVWAQRELEEIAHTNVQHLLQHRKRVVDFHTALRHTLYPYLFEERPFTPEDIKTLPSFD